MHRLVLASLAYALIAGHYSAVVSALNAQAYPAIDKIPAENTAWTQAVTSKNAQAVSDVTQCLDGKSYGLSFDDGPSIFTPALLDTLKANNLKATFFVVGSRVLERPEILKRAFDEGHEIALHTWSHPHSTRISSGLFVAELVWNARIIKDVIGVTPKVFRPPYGEANAAVRSLLAGMGLTSVTWSFDSTDSLTTTITAQQILGNVTEYLKTNPTGPVVLQHDLFSNEAEGGQLVAPLLGRSGYAIKTIAECVGVQAYDETFWTLFGGSTTTTTTATSTATSTSAASAATGTASSTSTSSKTSSNTPTSTSGTSGTNLSSSAQGRNFGVLFLASLLTLFIF